MPEIAAKFHLGDSAGAFTGSPAASFLEAHTMKQIPTSRKRATPIAIIRFTLVARLWTLTNGWPAVCGSNPIEKGG